MPPDMEFCLLGPLAVRCGGKPVPVPRGKQRAVLAALLLNTGRVVSLDELAAALWGPAPPLSAAASVRNYVKRLRQTLGEAGWSRISTQPRGYLIRADPAELDVCQFQASVEAAQAAARNGSWDAAAAQARSALGLWRGEPLADVESELLASREVPRLAELRLQACRGRTSRRIWRNAPPATAACWPGGACWCCWTTPDRWSRYGRCCPVLPPA